MVWNLFVIMVVRLTSSNLSSQSFRAVDHLISDQEFRFCFCHSGSQLSHRVLPPGLLKGALYVRYIVTWPGLLTH